MNQKLIAMLKAQIAELETFIEFTQSDDTAALQNYSEILSEARDKFEKVVIDERPKCDDCGERKEWEEMSNNDCCFDCNEEAEQERLDDNASYAFQCYPRN